MGFASRLSILAGLRGNHAVEFRGHLLGEIGLHLEHVGKALAAMHEAPGRKWTVEELAQIAGQSRSAFAERFQRLAGLAPLQYLTRWRMRCGYESEAAFAKVFKREIGLGPGAARRAARLPASA
jgi:AraC-like DNA-binding protein